MQSNETTPATPASTVRSTITMRRSRTDRMVAGVCGGAAAALGVDANLLRLGLVLLTVFGVGLGAVAYLAAWILVPETEVRSGHRGRT
jgi:phage shock protein PspC (stress-responsive transcriptional regulator)